jgi:hypothetical protein
MKLQMTNGPRTEAGTLQGAVQKSPDGAYLDHRSRLADWFGGEPCLSGGKLSLVDRLFNSVASERRPIWHAIAHATGCAPMCASGLVELSMSVLTRVVAAKAASLIGF